MKAKSLQDLQLMQKKITETRAQAAAQEAARQAEQARLLAAKELFTRSVGRVKPLPHKPVAALQPDPPPPIPVQHQKDEAEVMRESISDNFDVSS
nr:DNA mismatch repair protein MutS [Burkholderiaceae bacterium]